MFKLMFSNDDQISQISSSKQHSQSHPGFISNHYPLVNVYIAIENGPVEIVDIYPLKMVDLSIVFCMFTRVY